MQRVYFDSNMVIYFVDRHPAFFPLLMQRMFDESGKERVVYVTSDLVRLEARLLPLREGNLSLLERFDNFFDTTQTHGVNFGKNVFDLATQLRAEHRLKTPDALHLAVAIGAGCDEFWTNDQRLAKAAQGRLQIVTFDNTP